MKGKNDERTKKLHFYIFGLIWIDEIMYGFSMRCLMKNEGKYIFKNDKRDNLRCQHIKNNQTMNLSDYEEVVVLTRSAYFFYRYHYKEKSWRRPFS